MRKAAVYRYTKIIDFANHVNAKVLQVRLELAGPRGINETNPALLTNFKINSRNSCEHFYHVCRVVY